MAIDLQATMDEIREKLHEFCTEQKYRAANKSRETRAKMITEQGMCSGKLQTCKNLLAARIVEQCRNIRKGEEECMDTTPLKKIVRDSAVSYLLLRDAKFYLNTVGDYENITRAYCALDAASGKITGSRTFMGVKRLLPFQKKSYQEKMTEETRQQKEIFVDSYLEELLEMNGDIEPWLKKYHSSGQKPQPRTEFPPSGGGGLRNKADNTEDEEINAALSNTKDDFEEENFDNIEEQGSFEPPLFSSVPSYAEMPDEDMDKYLQSSGEENQEYHS